MNEDHTYYCLFYFFSSRIGSQKIVGLPKLDLVLVGLQVSMCITSND